MPCACQVAALLVFEYGNGWWPPSPTARCPELPQRNSMGGDGACILTDNNPQGLQINCWQQSDPQYPWFTIPSTPPKKPKPTQIRSQHLKHHHCLVTRSRSTKCGLGSADRWAEEWDGAWCPGRAASISLQEPPSLTPLIRALSLQKPFRTEGLPWGCSRPDFPKVLSKHLTLSAFWKL